MELSKFCYLGQQRSTHLRIAGTAQGVVHVFLNTGSRPALWGRDEGRLHELHWKILSVRSDLNLLTLHTDDMQPQSIARLLDTMLAEAATACAGCHGQDGMGLSAEFPNLAGQKEAYLAKQLRAFKQGDRKDPTMNAMAATLSEQDIGLLAAY